MAEGACALDPVLPESRITTEACEQVLGHRADRAASKVLKSDLAVPKKAGGSNALNLKGVSSMMRNLNRRPPLTWPCQLCHHC